MTTTDVILVPPGEVLLEEALRPMGISQCHWWLSAASACRTRETTRRGLQSRWTGGRHRAWRVVVIDASMALAWLFERQNPSDCERANRLLAACGEVPWWIPGLWHLEVRNALLVAERRSVLPQTAGDVRRFSCAQGAGPPSATSRWASEAQALSA